jgi:hypothetical protein
VAVRSARVVLAVTCLAGLVACSSSVSGKAVKAPQPAGSADAVVTLMNTGPYATAAGRPLGAAGDNPMSRGVLEAHRNAEYVVAPWEVDPALHAFGGLIDTALSGPMATAQMIADNDVLEPPLAEVAGAHGFFISGFSTARVTTQTGPESGGLINAVLRFPDPAAASEMAAKNSPPFGAPPGHPVGIRDFPDAAAQAFDGRDGLRVIEGPSDTVLFLFRRTSDRRRRSASVHAVEWTVAYAPPIGRRVSRAARCDRSTLGR